MKANGAQGRRFPGVITSGYLPNNGLVCPDKLSMANRWESGRGNCQEAT